MPIFSMGGGGGGDKSSTLPPPITNLTVEGGNAEMTVSFDLLASEYAQYLSDKGAYIIAVKEGGIPATPSDGDIIIKLDKAGAEL